jgi:adenosylhomocysteine nucleosidase
MNPSSEVRSAAPDTSRVLVMFAVPDEARQFKPPPGARCEVVVSGMGMPNAQRALCRALARGRPRFVLTCGYAGGLNPALRQGQVIFDADPASGLAGRLEQLGARSARFHCADRVIVTAPQKRALWEVTGADAVEMESAVIRNLCRERQIPAATIRVVSDPAGVDLPMDFNLLVGPDGNIRFGKLALALVRRPGLVPKLMRFQRELHPCASKLAGVLRDLLNPLA